MPRSLIPTSSTPAPLRYASGVLNDYEHWLNLNFATTSSYLPHARSFLLHYKTGGSLSTQLDTVSRHKGAAAKSLLKRFQIFLLEKGIDELHNDLQEERLPKASILVKLFLVSVKDRLKSKTSRQTYANVLNGYLKYAGDVRHLEKFTAERFIFSVRKSDFTSRLYASVIKSFVQWILDYLDAPDEELTPMEVGIKYSFDKKQTFQLKAILSIKTKSPDTGVYHKVSLTKKQRDRLLSACQSSHDKAMISLMAWNGLRPIEVVRLNVKDINLKGRTISIWGKGRSKKHLQNIPLLKIPTRELKAFLKQRGLNQGKLFPKLSYIKLTQMVAGYFDRLKLSGERRTLHGLRHTAGQLLYDDGVPLEFIQKLLRHKTMESTLVYAQKAVDRAYEGKMRRL